MFAKHERSEEMLRREEVRKTKCEGMTNEGMTNDK
jgi:hypothetical protein